MLLAGITTFNGSAIGGTSKISVNNSGNTAMAGTLAVTGATTLTGALAANGGITCDTNAFTVEDTTGNTAIGGTLAVTGATGVDGNFDVATNKFTVAASSGNTAIAGTLGVSNVTSITPAAITSSGEDDKVLNLTQTLNDSNAAGGSDTFRFIKANLTQTDVTGWDNIYLMDLQVGGTSKISVNNSGNTAIAGTLAVTGATTLTGALAANGGITCDTNAFTVEDTTGNTAIGGTLAVTGATGVDGNFDVATNKFTVAASSGNTAIAGTLGVSNVTSITPAAITSSGEDDKVLNLTQTLNDSNAAGGSDTFRFIKANLTQTDVTGWDNIYLMDLQVGGTSKISVNNSGNTAIAGTLAVTGATTLTGALAANGGITCDTNAFTVEDTTETLRRNISCYRHGEH